MISKPQPGEYAPYAEKYVTQVSDGTDVLALLTDLKDSTYDFLMTLPPEKADYAYGPDKWTIKELVGHMIDAERVFAFRAMCFARGEQQPFPGFDEDAYVANASFSSRTLADLAAEFKAIRESTLFLVRSISKTEEERIGTASGKPVSVRALIFMMAGHELHHLQLIKERYL